MNIPRLLLAALGAFLAYFVTGGLLFVLFPGMRDEFQKHQSVYRGKDDMNRVMPLGMAAMFLAMLVLAVLYAGLAPAYSGFASGLRFGLLIAVFTSCAFVMHNHLLLNVSWGLTLKSGLAYFVEWLAVGIAIGFIYRAPA